MKRSSQIFFLTLFCCFALLFLTGDAYAADVLQTVRDKAAKFIHDLRPLIFVLAGFGLIGFAFGAIFGKISWKWFANIAIGLFLVANVGLFIDYFATKSGAAGQYAQDLGYGKYLDESGKYTATDGSSDSPKSQNTPNGENEGEAENSNSDGLDGACVPGTGTGCEEKSEEEASGEEASGEEAANSEEAACDAKGGYWSNNRCLTLGGDSGQSGAAQENSTVPSGEQMNALAQRAQEEFLSNGKIDMNQLLRDEVAAGRMTPEQAAQAGAIFTEVANAKGGDVGAAIEDVLNGSQEQMEEEAAANKDMAASAGNIGDLYGQIINEEAPEEEPLPGTGFESKEAECKAKGGYWVDFTCREIIEEETPDEEPLPGTGFEQQEAACKAKGGYWVDFTCKEIIEEETPEEEPLPGTGFEYDVDGGELDEVVVTGKDYSKEKQNCTLTGGKWNSSSLSCEYEALNSPISIPGMNKNTNTSNVPSGEQMNSLAQKAKEQYNSNGKVDMNQLLREEVAAGNMTPEQAAQAGAIFTEVANAKGGDVGAAINDVLKGSQEQVEEEKASSSNNISTTNNFPASNNNTEVNQPTSSEKEPEEEGSGISQYGCQKMGGTWNDATGTCQGVSAPVSTAEDDEEEYEAPVMDEEDSEEDRGISYYGCNKMGGNWVDGECILP